MITVKTHLERCHEICDEALGIFDATGLTPRQLLEQRDEVYRERNKVVAAFARAAIALGRKAVVTETCIPGWDDEWHNCVYIDLPTGQVSWHFHDRDFQFFSDLPEVGSVEWDKHTTPEKYYRLHHYRPTLAEVLEQRDALANALKSVCEAFWKEAEYNDGVIYHNGHECNIMMRPLEQARAALAKVDGELCK